MYFTKEDIQKIKDALLDIGIKDTALQETDTIFPQDIITIVQNGKNQKNDYNQQNYGKNNFCISGDDVNNIIEFLFHKRLLQL